MGVGAVLATATRICRLPGHCQAIHPSMRWASASKVPEEQTRRASPAPISVGGTSLTPGY